MTNLSEVINVPPKRRITVPEHHLALIVPLQLAEELRGLCIMLRKGRKPLPDERQGIRSIAGDLLLTIIEAEEDQGQ